MSKICAALLVLTQLGASVALADSGSGEVIIAGEIAPASGVLVEQGRYVEFIEAQAAVKDLGERLVIQVKYCEASEGFYKAEVARVSARDWYEDPSLNRWVGFGLGIVATSLAVWGATKVTGAAQ